ncbi:hypothetical protein QJS04_geneDACA012572 [Acorus gramineus]|uniref:HMA domain-containing protein n=1 Tax=Acorus gramineus TaxID=55184 RepID=A0AAV9B4S5_ACOGR|nr:hypothetical protein QJS04_geneDACA012572 [Acorus gramineus]
MHCEGCARKVRRCLKGFPGVEDVKTDCKTHKVVVKGKDADPLKVVERVQKKSGRKVELLTPLPKPKPEEPKKVEEEKKPKPEEKKEEPPVILVVLKVHMHCEACAQEIKKRILKMKGVQSAEPELKTSQVSVKGVFDPPKLVEYVYKRTGKHAVIVKQEPEKKEGEKAKAEEKKEEKKSEGGGGGEKEKDKEKKGEGEGGEGGGEKGENKKEGEEAKGGEEETMKTVEVGKNEFYYYHPRYAVEYAYPPQIFSDENPNACSVM